MRASTNGHDPELFSIGDVAAATGISVDTIRVWERRYGRPVPVRLESGHRRYTSDQVTWLRKVAEALAGGFRPSLVIPLDDSELAELLEPAADGAADPWIAAVLDDARAYRAEAIRRRLAETASELGPREFVLARIAPLLTALGRAWADGSLDIRHEHFLSDLLEDALHEVHAVVPPAAEGPLLLLATLSGERHRLGLRMVGVLAAVNRVPVGFLGADSPIPEIVRAAVETGAAAVGVSVSLSSGGPATDRELAALRDALPEGVTLLVGGRGARGVRRGPRGIDYVEGLAGLERWLADFS